MPVLKNERHEAFAQHYAANLSIRQATQALEVSYRTGVRYYANEEVKQRIVEIAGVTLADLGLKQEMVVEGLIDIALNDDESTQNRLRAYELLGRHLAMFTDKVESGGQGHDEWTKLLLLHMKTDDLYFLR